MAPAAENHRRNTAIKLGSGILAQGFGLASGYLFYFVMARSLSTESFGHLSITLTLAAIGITVAGLGLPVVIVRDIAAWQGPPPVWPGMGWTFRLVFRASCVTAIIFAALAWPLGVLVFDDAGFVPFLFLGAATVVPGTIVQLVAGGLQGKSWSSQATLFRAGYVTAGASLVFLALHASWHAPLAAMAAQFLVLATVAICGTWLLFRCGISNLLHGGIEPAQKRETLTGGVALVWAGTAGMLLTGANTLMLGYFAGAATAGIFALAFRIGIIGNQVEIVCNTVFSPRFAAAFRGGDRAGQQRLAGIITSLSFAGTLAFVVAAVLFAEPVLAIFGPEYVAGATAFRIVAAGELLAAVAGAPGIVILMTGMERVYRNWAAMFLAFSIALNLVLIPRYGMTGAALATALTTVGLRLAMTWQVWKHRRLNTLLFFSSRAWDGPVPFSGAGSP